MRHAVWAMGDIGYGLMAWANIIAIALLAPKAVALLKDYEKQKKEGKDPTFDPAGDLGIEGVETWSLEITTKR